MRKKRATFGDVLLRIAMVVCSVVMLACIAYLVSLAVESHRNKQANLATAQRYVTAAADLDVQDDGQESGAEGTPLYTVDFASLQSASPYAIGWIQVSGIDVIDYPVVQCSNDTFFLTHSWEGAENRYGAIFMEAANDPGFNDCYTLIYGHYMKDGTMFGSLLDYQDADFFAENGGVITIYLPGETRTYQVFSVERVDGSDPSVFSTGFVHDEIFGEFVRSMKERSLYDTGVDVSAEDDVISLSTCAGSGSPTRVVLHAKLVSTR